MSTGEAQADAGLRRHQFEFRGTGGEYFGIWIVNLLLTIITLGIYGAWAKVRTWRYFYANTFIGDHPLDYHASPVRILIGRLIAIGILVLYSLSETLTPRAGIFWGPFALVAFPWLIVSSLRFNARNTSYRNVRLNFTGSYWGAIKAYILWPIAAFLTLFTLSPLTKRAQDYYYINHHTFGGRPFRTEFTGWQIYRVFLTALAIVIVPAILMGISLATAGALAPGAKGLAHASPALLRIMGLSVLLFYAGLFFVGAYMISAIYNLSLGHMDLDGRHKFESMLSPFPILWISFSNLILLVITFGLFYPWAMVRMRRYMTSKLALLAATDLDEFTSEVVATQGAIGEEVAAFFDINIGL
jgi:uncharacterized membrane protein YjgN (DUF898 family)